MSTDFFNYEDYETISKNGMRLYNTPIGYLPSITTVLGHTEPAEKKASLESWRNALGPIKSAEVSKKATDHGTMVHLLAERFLKGEQIDAPVNGKPIPWPDMAAFNSLKLKLKLISPIWGQEKSIYSYSLLVAGRFDCAGLYKGIPSIIDFKTSLNRLKNREEIKSYALQLAFYAVAHNEMFDTDIKQGVVLLAGAGGMPQEFIFNIEDELYDLVIRVDSFMESNADKL